MLEERNVDVTYESIRKWILRFASLFDSFRKKNTKYYMLNWNVDETYIKIKKKQYYYYRAIDSEGHVIDFYLSEKRDRKSAEIILQ